MEEIPAPTEIKRGLSDERFAFEVIRNLGDSLRAVSEDVKRLRGKTDEVLEKVVAIEAHSMVDRIAKLEAKMERFETEALKSKGLKEAANWFFQSPLIMWIVTLLFGLYIWISNLTSANK